ncbi:hypothetical protein DFR74_112222 [Nocardia puris]|uniref:Uncharacterized protein n=1 Tax=Nocardia puris TaxID=208602 RepID=A0A366DC99_9NOCA|nr:hypothetical protein DFR74_112222 [Nocardia puris]
MLSTLSAVASAVDWGLVGEALLNVAGAIIRAIL